MLKVERANKHLDDLKAAFAGFRDSKPYSIGVKTDPQTRQLVYYVKSIKEIPSSFALISGDVIQNLRTALDQLAYQLFLVGTKASQGDGRHIYFPIGDSREKFNAALSSRTSGIRSDAITQFRALEPYRNGKGHKFWILERLNNTDKHRLLLTVGSRYRSVNIGAVISHLAKQEAKKAAWEPELQGAIGDFDLYMMTADGLFPSKVGDELLRDLPNSEPNPKVGFAFELAIAETGVVNGEPLIETLEQLVKLVTETISKFQPLMG